MVERHDDHHRSAKKIDGIVACGGLRIAVIDGGGSAHTHSIGCNTLPVFATGWDGFCKAGTGGGFGVVGCESASFVDGVLRCVVDLFEEGRLLESWLLKRSVVDHVRWPRILLQTAFEIAHDRFHHVGGKWIEEIKEDRS